ncbi:MAG: hypothetical protein GXO91_05340 [FCB group bacterium]|nr:hypothetical protein [FCB group bacterium]
MKIHSTAISLKQPKSAFSAGQKNPVQTATSKDAELRKQSRQLEAVFITQMIKAMEKTIPESSLGGTKNTLSAMMFSTVLGDAIAEQGGVGLSDMIYESLADKDTPVNLDEIKADAVLENFNLLKAMNISTTEENSK